MKFKISLSLLIILSLPFVFSFIVGNEREPAVLEDGAIEYYGNSNNIGDVISDNLDKDQIIVAYVKLRKENEVNSLIFMDELGYVSIEDSNGKENIFSHIKEGGKLEVDGEGKLIGADFIVNEKGGVYSFGGNKIIAPPNTHIIFKGRKIEMVLPPGEKLEKFPEYSSNAKDYVIRIKGEENKEITLPNGYSLQQGELIFKKGEVFLEKGKSAKINGFLVNTKEDLVIKFYKGFFTDFFSKFFGNKGSENFVKFYDDKILMSNQESNNFFSVEFLPNEFIGMKFTNSFLQDIELPSRGYFQKGDQGDEIKKIQKLLGFQGSYIDGKFGSITQNALKIWQSKNGLKNDGLFGLKSLSTALGFDKTKTIRISPLGGKAIISRKNNRIQIDVNKKSTLKLGTKELDIQGDKNIYKRIQRELINDLPVPINLNIRSDTGEESVRIGYDERGEFTYTNVKSKGRSIRGRIYSGIIKIAEPILSSLGFKEKSPYASYFLSYFFSGKDGTLEINNLPDEWKDWIIKETRGKEGIYRIDAYNSPLFDLRNTLGHFNVIIKNNRDGTKLYQIEDVYAFGYRENDAKDQKGRHGFPIGDLSESKIKFLNKYIFPSKIYKNPGGFNERFEIKTVGNEKILFIPQQWLNERGRSFKVKSEFVVVT